MTTDRLIEAGLGLLAAGAAWASYLLATRANRAQASAAAKAVDAGAYGRAQEIYESAIGTLKAQTAQLHDEIVALQGEVSRLQRQSGELSAEVSRLRGVNDELRSQIAVLRGGS